MEINVTCGSGDHGVFQCMRCAPVGIVCERYAGIELTELTSEVGGHDARVYLNTMGANNTISLYPWTFSFRESARSYILVAPDVSNVINPAAEVRNSRHIRL